MDSQNRSSASSESEAIDVPEVVHHYTSMETFLKIVQSKQLWATSVAYLNDTSEQDHFFKRALARVDDVLSNHPEWHKWNFSDTTPQEKSGTCLNRHASIPCVILKRGRLPPTMARLLPKWKWRIAWLSNRKSECRDPAYG
jgi:hypothetical protein